MSKYVHIFELNRIFQTYSQNQDLIHIHGNNIHSTNTINIFIYLMFSIEGGLMMPVKKSFIHVLTFQGYILYEYICFYIKTLVYIIYTSIIFFRREMQNICQEIHFFNIEGFFFSNIIDSTYKIICSNVF